MSLILPLKHCYVSKSLCVFVYSKIPPKRLHQHFELYFSGNIEFSQGLQMVLGHPNKAAVQAFTMNRFDSTTTKIEASIKHHILYSSFVLPTIHK